MKTFIPYTLVVSGIPILFGFLVGMLVTMLIGLVVWVFSPGSRNAVGLSPVKQKIANTCMGVASGFAAVFAAAFIFHLVSQPLGLAVLFIIVGWKVAYFSVSVKHGQSPQYLFWSLVGVGFGWYDVFRIFSF